MGSLNSDGSIILPSELVIYVPTLDVFFIIQVSFRVFLQAAHYPISYPHESFCLVFSMGHYFFQVGILNKQLIKKPVRPNRNRYLIKLMGNIGHNIVNCVSPNLQIEIVN